VGILTYTLSVLCDAIIAVGAVVGTIGFVMVVAAAIANLIDGRDL